jgi:glutamyl-tRNA synthetase
MESLKPRAKNLDELAEGALFLFDTRPLPLDEKAAALLEGDATGTAGKDGRSTSGGCRLDRYGGARRGGTAPLPRMRESVWAKSRNPCALRSPGAPPRPGFSTCWCCWVATRALGRIADQMTKQAE